MINSLCFDVIVDLAGTENNLSDFLRGYKLFIIVLEEWLPSAIFIKVLDVRGGTFVSQELFGSNDDQWLSKWQSHVSSEQMEIICSV